MRRHGFFRGVDFKRVARRGYEPAFRPPLEGAADVANFDTSFTDEPPVDSLVEGSVISDAAAAHASSGGDASADDPFAGWECYGNAAYHAREGAAASLPRRFGLGELASMNASFGSLLPKS